jgi:PAS domain-containing protein
MSGNRKIGTLQGFDPSANRQLERIREIMNEDSDIFEIVPGRTEFTISIDRIETYNQAMLDALGYTSFEDISQITDPIQIVETITGPVSKGSPKRTIVYQNCWIQGWSKTIREGTITVTERVTLWPERILRQQL